jgi:hypothetical protein
MASDYSAVLQEARQYTSTVKGMFKRKKFNNQAISNIACLAAEQFMVSYIMTKGSLPNHHSLDFLIDEVARLHNDIPLSLIDDLHFMEEFQNLCVIENIGMKIPDDLDMERIINALMGLDVVLFP